MINEAASTPPCMSEFDAYRITFEKGASRFVRWSLSPVLVIFAVIISFQAVTCREEGRIPGMVICVVLVVTCIAGLLALWGVRHAGRIVTGIIGAGYAAYLIQECFVDFDGNWGWGARRSETTPVNSILGFLIFGVPCLIYTIFGRFTIRPPLPNPAFEMLFLTMILDDGKYGSPELRSHFRKLAEAISDRLCDGITADYNGEDEDEEGKASIGFWATNAEKFAGRILAEFPAEPLLANCTWVRQDATGTKTVLTNPCGSMD